MAIDIFDYLPSFADLSLADVFSNRVKLEERFKEVFPDIDTSPNSVFGNQYITPAAFHITALEVALNSFVNDIDLEYVFANGATNEDVTKAFISNFSNFSFLGTTESSGVIRLTFDRDALIEIKEDIQLYFEDYPDNIITLNTAESGTLYALPTYSDLGKYANEKHLIYKDEGEYTIDIPVKGVIGASFPIGEPLLSYDALPGLVSIQAVTEFLPASLAQSTDIMAMISQLKTTNSDAGILTRKGISSLTRKLFDVIDRVSAVRSGDYEMLRDGVGSLGIGVNAVDLYIKTNPELTYEDQNIRCQYFSTDQSFIYKLSLPQTPLDVKNVVYTPNPDLNLEWEIVSRSTDKKYPYLSAAGSNKQEHWLIIKMPFQDGAPSINVNDTDFANFQINYGYDLKQLEVSSYFDNKDNIPSTIDVLVKGFVPVEIDTLAIHYKPITGTKFDSAGAANAIADYINSIGHPESFLESTITEIVSFFGGLGVKSINIQATVKFNIGDYVIDYNDPLPTVDFEAFTTAKRKPQVLEINSVKHMDIEAVDGLLGVIGKETYCAIGPRNISYRVDPSIISFIKA